jgi:hypothetical protein
LFLDRIGHRANDKSSANCRYLWAPSAHRISKQFPAKNLGDGVSVILGISEYFRKRPRSWAEVRDGDAHEHVPGNLPIGDGIEWVADFRFDFRSLDTEPPLMLRVLREAFGSEGFIPYDKAVRRQKLAHAYEYLADYLP